MAKGDSIAELFIDLRASFGKLSGDLGSATKQFTNFQKDINGIFNNISTIAKVALGVTSVLAVKQLANSLGELAKRGETVGSIADSFRKTGIASRAITDAQKATLGLVSAFDLMAVANEASIRQIPKLSENFALLADYAGRFANATGGNVLDTLKKLTQAFTKAESEQLRQIGVVLDLEKTYEAYATSLGRTREEGKKWADALSLNEQVTARQSAAIEQLKRRNQELGPITESAGNAFSSMQRAMKDAFDEIAIGINENKNLAEAYREVSDTLDDIDWKEATQGIVEFTANIVSLANTALPPLIDLLNQTAKLINGLAGAGDQGLIDNLDITIGSKQKALETQLNPYSNSFSKLIARGEGSPQQLANEIADLIKVRQGLQEQMLRENREREKALETERQTTQATREQAQAEEEAAAELARRTKEAEKLKKEYEQIAKRLSGDEFKYFARTVNDGLQDAIDSLDAGAFENYLAVFKEVTKEGFLQGYEGASPDILARAEVLADQMAETEAEAMREKFKDANEAVAEDHREKMAKAIEENAKQLEESYRNAVDGFKNSFRDAIDAAASGDFSGLLKDFAVDFAANLTASITTGVIKNPTIISGFGDLGALLASGVAELMRSLSGGGSGASGAAGGIAGLLGQGLSAIGSLFTPSPDPNFVGPPAPPGMGNQAAIDAAGAANIAGGVATIIGSLSAKNPPNSNAGTGQAAGSAIGGAIGLFGGPAGFAAGASIGSILGGMLGGLFKTGLNHPESKARVKFEQWLEDQFAELGKIRFFDEQGKLGGYFDGNIRGKEFTELFNQPNWVSQMDDWDAQAKGTFLGLGKALKELLGITEDVGDQLGFILGENLSANIDNARVLVQKLGLTFEQISEALLKTALEGEITWLEFNSAIRDTAEAFKPGLVAVGAFGQAFQTVIDSAGQGSEATIGFKNIAVEAMEAGVKTMDELKNKLLADGYDPEYVDALFQAAAQRGINTLEEWATASDATAGAVVGDMEAISSKLREEWEKMREDLRSLAEGLKDIPSKIDTEINIKVNTEYDEATREVVQRLGRGALPAGVPLEGSRELSESVSSSTSRLGRALQQGRSFSAPTSRALARYQSIPLDSLGKLPYASLKGDTPVTINVDAKGAGPGVELSIKGAIKEMEGRLVQHLMASLAYANGRGGRQEDMF